MQGFSGTSFWNHWARITTRHPRLIVTVLLMITCLFAYFLTDIKAATNIEDFLHPEAKTFNKALEEKFNEGVMHAMIFESQTESSLLEPALLKKQLEIIQEIKKQFNVKTYSLIEGINEGLKQAKGKSLFEYNDYAPIAQALLALSGPRTIRDLERVYRNVLSHPEAIHDYAKLRLATLFAPPTLMGGNFSVKFHVPYVKAILVLLEQDRSLSNSEQKGQLIAIRSLTDRFKPPDVNIYHLSQRIAGRDLDDRSRRNALLMGLILVVVDALLLWGIFHNRREVFITLFIIVTSCIWTFGLAGLLTIRISFLHLIALPILLGTGIDDSVVFGCRLAIERARQNNLRDAIRSTFVFTGNGIFLTTFTTFVAFLCGALTAQTEALQSFCFLVSASMVIVFLLTILLQGVLRVLMKTESAPLQGERPLSFWLQGPARVAVKAVSKESRRIGIYSGLLVLVAFSGSFYVEAHFDRDDFLKKSMPSYQANLVHKKYFGRYNAGYIMIDGKVENPLVLIKMRELEKRLNKYPMIEKILGHANTQSILTFLDKAKIRIQNTTSVRTELDQIMSNHETANYVLNQTYSEGAKTVIHKQGDQYDAFLISLRVLEDEARKVTSLQQAIENEIDDIGLNKIPGIRTRIGGETFVFHKAEMFYFADFSKSFLWSILIIFIILLTVWRKFWYSFCAIVPIIFSVILTLGIMGALGIKMSPINLMIGAIVVGLGIDYPIHIIERFIEEKKLPGGPSNLGAVRASLVQVAPGLWGACLTTIMGFCAALVLTIPVAESFGLLTGVALLLAYVASILVLPVLLVGRHRVDFKAIERHS